MAVKNGGSKPSSSKGVRPFDLFLSSECLVVADPVQSFVDIWIDQTFYVEKKIMMRLAS